MWFTKSTCLCCAYLCVIFANIGNNTEIFKLNREIMLVVFELHIYICIIISKI